MSGAIGNDIAVPNKKAVLALGGVKDGGDGFRYGWFFANDELMGSRWHRIGLLNLLSIDCGYSFCYNEDIIGVKGGVQNAIRNK